MSSDGTSRPAPGKQRDTTNSSTNNETINKARRRASSSGTTSGYTYDSRDPDEEEDEGEEIEAEEWEGGQRVRAGGERKKGKDEPMSPVLAVFYVTVVYLIFQLLTRTDELEILSHLPATSSLLRNSPLSFGGANMHSDMSQSHHSFNPYGMPQIPSPIPRISSSSDGSTSFWRLLLGIVAYPIYLLITLIAIPFPLILNLLHLLARVLLTLAYPFTSTARLMIQTFILTPLGLLHSVLGVFYPILAFISGIVGIGCLMGIGVGWVGKWALDWLLNRRSRSIRRRKKSRSSATKSSRSKRSEAGSGRSSKRDVRIDPRAISPESLPEQEKIVTPKTPRELRAASFREMLAANLAQIKQDRLTSAASINEEARRDTFITAMASASQPPAKGIRRRTYGLGS